MPMDLVLPPPNTVGSTQRIGTCQYFQRRTSAEQSLPLLEPPVHTTSTLPSPVSLPSPRTFDIFDRPTQHQRTSPKPLNRLPPVGPMHRHVLKPLDIPYARNEGPQLRPSPLPSCSPISGTSSQSDLNRYRDSVPRSEPDRMSPPRMPLPMPRSTPSTYSPPHYHLPSPRQTSQTAQLVSPISSYPSPSGSTDDMQGGESRSSKAPSRGWKPEEDERLVAAMQIHNGSNYKAIAEMVGNGRTPKQCRERYHENLAGHLSHEKATDAEIEYIVQLVERHGKKWSKIAQVLGNRAPNTVKNFYNSRKKPVRSQKAQVRQAQVSAQQSTQRPTSDSLPSYTQQRPLPPFGQQAMHLPSFGQAQPQAVYAGY